MGGHSHGHASDSQFYWKEDLQDMERDLAVLRKGPNGIKAERDFRTKRVAQVEALMKVRKSTYGLETV